MSRYATRWNKRDESEPAIVAALAKLGVDWHEGGPLDGWVHIGGQWIPVELKTPVGTLTKGQKEFIEMCVDRGRAVVVWRTPEEAIECVQASWEHQA